MSALDGLNDHLGSARGSMDKPDPYAELCALMQDLEARGVPEADVIDAMFRLAVIAAARLYGPEAVSHSLLDMAEVVEVATIQPR
jgi:hypothetical protein